MVANPHATQHPPSCIPIRLTGICGPCSARTGCAGRYVHAARRPACWRKPDDHCRGIMASYGSLPGGGAAFLDKLRLWRSPLATGGRWRLQTSGHTSANWPRNWSADIKRRGRWQVVSLAAEIDGIKAMALQPASRAEVLFGVGVRSLRRDVRHALEVPLQQKQAAGSRTSLTSTSASTGWHRATFASAGTITTNTNQPLMCREVITATRHGERNKVLVVYAKASLDGTTRPLARDRAPNRY